MYIASNIILLWSAFIVKLAVTFLLQSSDFPRVLEEEAEVKHFKVSWKTTRPWANMNKRNFFI